MTVYDTWVPQSAVQENDFGLKGDEQSWYKKNEFVQKLDKHAHLGWLQTKTNVPLNFKLDQSNLWITMR